MLLKLFSLSSVIFFCLGCATNLAPYQEADADGFSVPSKQNSENKPSDDLYASIESQIQQFKRIYLTAQLPELPANPPFVQQEQPISTYVLDQAFYDESYNELDFAKPPKDCQKLLLVSKAAKNRKREMGKLATLFSKGKKFDRYLTTAGFGIHVRIDPALKIKSFVYLIRDQKEVDPKLLDYYTSQYGYPKELNLPSATKAYGWGIEYEQVKYIVVAINYALPSQEKKPTTYNFTQISSYRLDKTRCKD